MPLLLEAVLHRGWVGRGGSSGVVLMLRYGGLGFVGSVVIEMGWRNWMIWWGGWG